MVNIHDCLQSAVSASVLHPARAREAKENFDSLVARYEANGLRPNQARATAAADLREATRKARRSRFHVVTNQLQAMRRLRQQIETAPDPALALRNLLEWSEGSGYTGESVRGVTEAYIGQINATIEAVLKKHGLNIVGNVRNRAGFENLIRELHGEASGDAIAAGLADAIRTAQDRLRRAANGFGADIGKLADYGLSHAHDVFQIRQAGFARWASDIEIRLNWSRIDDVTTGKPFAANAGEVPDRAISDRFLRDVYDSITSRGWDDREPSLSGGGRALYNRRGDHRVLHFLSGTDWMAYNKAYGTADPFSALVNGLHGLARDVALMRVLGPNPRQGLSYARQVAKKQAELLDAKYPLPEGKTRADRVDRQGNLAASMLSIQNGDANVPGNLAWARFFSGTRAYLTAAQLGSATLSSFSDLATMSVAAKVMGMHPSNVIARSVQLTASAATRDSAARMGFVAETLADAGSGSARYFGRMFGTGIADRLASFTMRASMLSFLTDMRRVALQMEWAGDLADQADRTFADLNPLTRNIFEQRGITAADWDLLRDPAHRFTAPNGSDFITGHFFLQTQKALPRAEAEGLAIRLDMALREQLELAVPTASLEGRARMGAALQKGTIPGEMINSFGMYKSFSVSLMLGQMRRFSSLPNGAIAGGKWGYAVQMSAGLLAMGALAIQLKELAKGNDPRPMTEKKFWGAALLQGGGLGIFGDFFAASESRVGGGIAETVAGPVVGLGGDLATAFSSNVSRAGSGEDLLIGRDAAKLVGRYTPVASSLFYARAGYDRLVSEQLQRWWDPEAERIWRQQERRRLKDYGAGSWWSRGQTLPDRPPNFANAFGETPQ